MHDPNLEPINQFVRPFDAPFICTFATDKKQNKFFLNPEERVALIEGKVERARAQVEAMIAQIEAVKKVKRNEQINS